MFLDGTDTADPQSVSGGPESEGQSVLVNARSSGDPKMNWARRLLCGQQERVILCHPST